MYLVSWLVGCIKPILNDVLFFCVVTGPQHYVKTNSIDYKTISVIIQLMNNNDIFEKIILLSYYHALMLIERIYIYIYYIM